MRAAPIKRAAPGMLHRARYAEAACCRAMLRAARYVERRAALSKWRRAAGGTAPAGGAGGGAGPADGAEQRAVSVRCVELHAVIQDCAKLAAPASELLAFAGDGSPSTLTRALEMQALPAAQAVSHYRASLAKSPSTHGVDTPEYQGV
ncbi:hypothetical protein T492DRAFT_858280 [Pavlovales sp. CCMP2436]|nr:hypothetical protein T492DRAFT_858280 [Pavlovales sp. CCMP2436]